MELFKQEKDKISLLLKKKKNLGNGNLETNIRSNYNNDLNQNQFTNILKKVKKSKFQLQNIEGNNSHLLITLKDNNIAVKIYGDKNITKYCETNKIEDIEDSIEILDLGESNKLYINNYNLELKLKEEKNITKKSPRGAKVLSELFKYDKFYSYIKTYSFINEEETYQLCFNIFKSSNTEEIINKGRKFLKKDVKFNKKKFVKKPKDEKRSFSLWWNSLNNTDEVELSDEKFNKKITYKTLDTSGTLENSLQYEVKLNYLGNNKSKNNKNILDNYLENVEFILKTLQHSDAIISEYEIRQLKGKFKSLTKLYNFRQSFPFSKTLETKNIIRLHNDEYKNNVNIRRNYCVTEKADGERNLLYVDDNGDVYLINRQELVRKMNINFKNISNTVLDGEFVTKLKGGIDIKLFLVFDLYFLNGEDYRERIFMRPGKKKNEEIPKSRLETLGELLSEMEVNEIMEIRQKEFLYGDYDTVSENGMDRINKYQIALQTVEDPEEKNHILLEIEKELKDTKIFKVSESILDRINNEDYEYETDGLIYTPIDLTVGEEPEINKRNKYGGRWGRSFKWKKSDENSIDFLIQFATNPNGEFIDKTFMDDMKRYRKVYLKVAYDKKNMMVNRAKIVNESPNYMDGYNSILFEPTTNFVARPFECYLEITNNGGLVCKGDGKNVGDVINDNDIIEFYYDYNPKLKVNKDHRFRWVPMRKRENSVPNSFETANNIWDTIFNPITEESICSGRNLGNIKSEYYSGDRKEKNIFKNFHNLIKKNLINSVVTPGATLLDIGTGECGDLHKWLGNDLSYVVGLEYNQYNINNNINGGFKRIIQAMNSDKYKDKTLVKNIFLIWANGGKNILDGSSGMDKLNKFYIDVLWGNQTEREMNYLLRNPKLKANVGRFKGGFNIVSCQFCMHYFFKNKTMLKEFLTNITENLMIGGKFIATCFDGKKIFKSLDGKDFIEQTNSEGKIIWKIDKRYKEKQLLDDETSLGIPIGVYVNTFNNMEEEYLVNLDYLEKILPEFGLELELKESFEKHYNAVRANGTLEDEVSKESQEFSFLNTSITIVKKNKYEPKVGGGQVNVERFISNADVLDEQDLGIDILDDDDYGEEVEEETFKFPTKQKGGGNEELVSIDSVTPQEMNILDLGNDNVITDANITDSVLQGGNLDLTNSQTEMDLGNSKLSEVALSDTNSQNLDIPTPNEVDTSNLAEVNLDAPVVPTPNEVDVPTPNEVDTLNLAEVNLDAPVVSTPNEVDVPTPNEVDTSNLAEVNLDAPVVTTPNEVDVPTPNEADTSNLAEVNLDTNDAVISSPNVKVIKLTGDANVLNMINK